MMHVAQALVLQRWVTPTLLKDRGVFFAQGVLDLEIACTPFPATDWALLNASAMGHLRRLAAGDEQCKDEPLRYHMMSARDYHFTTAQEQFSFSVRSPTHAALQSMHVWRIWTD